ncbi:MAG: hypothetical protein HC871_15295, partial [Rhizobiales bacterium]|nr:hypothetical protein [Hyphomicrobiales bacterium]
HSSPGVLAHVESRVADLEHGAGYEVRAALVRFAGRALRELDLGSAELGSFLIRVAEGPVEKAADESLVALALQSAGPPLPEPSSASWLGLALPLIRLDPQTPSAVARIKLVLHAERVC